MIKVKAAFLQKAYKLLFTHKGYLALAFLLAVVFIIFTEQAKALLVLLVLGFFSSFISLYKRVVRLPPALELITFTTVIITLIYGPVVAIIYSIIVTFTSEIVSGYPDAMTLTYIPSRIAMVIGTYIFREAEIVTLGFWMIILFNAVQQPMFWALTDFEKRVKSVYFTVLNIPLSFLLFKFFGAALLQFLRAIA